VDRLEKFWNMGEGKKGKYEKKISNRCSRGKEQYMRGTTRKPGKYQEEGKLTHQNQFEDQIGGWGAGRLNFPKRTTREKTKKITRQILSS